ncbi:MAG: ankyrin repeat domain-containing protein, partial [Wenzhouxiangella sp.]|nr:ankyrin repeat domain-containing protein [Wenzhouxiangella sp.]
MSGLPSSDFSRRSPQIYETLGLILEVKKGQVSIVRYETPMHWAAQYGHVGVIQTLLEHGEDINARDSHDRTPLHWAAASGHENLVKMLLENGADRAVRNRDGLSPLDLAIHAEHKGVVELLKPGSGSGHQPRHEDSEQDGAGQPATRSESNL